MMSKRILTLPVLGLIAAAAGLFAAPATARQIDPNTPPDSLSRVIACRDQTDSAARLSCYDAAVAAFESARQEGEVVVVDRAQVTAARRQLFGFSIPALPSLFDGGGSPSEPMESLESPLERALRGSDGKWVFTLADGSVWRQTDTERMTFFNRPGEAVRVRRAALGSYRLTVGNSRAARVQRQ